MRLMERGAKVLANRLAQADGELVTYARPGVVPTAGRPVTAIVMFPEHVVGSSLDKPARIESRKADFIIRISDFAEAFAGTNLEGQVPNIGDWVDRLIGGKTVRYLVKSDKGIPAFEYGDSEQLTFRIHTRLMLVLPESGRVRIYPQYSGES